ncbi:hypothetical protein QJ857_gp1063 [Tupanvirus soda lake]|uniref:Uncharacterized protein n=2 Tax=Tupanvirus TaxID=2094720 RepID=A0A6N1P1S2_9VIRU|nr:hypothetical protein QJ857_gp1063 [Tupanvirus soda lake]QKU34991.1 hypothetical protein [Tupanvirus soda lake]
MSEVSCINFTYKSPHQDIESVMGFNSDGSVNIKYTLISLRNLLSHNINILNKLIEKSENITNIIPIGYGVVGINIDSPTITQYLLDENILTKMSENMEDEVEIGEFNFSDDEETNQDRLNIVNNLTNHNDTNNIFDNDLSESDSDSESDDIIDDEKNTKSILSKYIGIINERNSDESEEEENSQDESDLEDKENE